MTIEYFLVNDLKPVEIGSSFPDVLKLIEDYRFSHFPVVRAGGILEGNISYEKLIEEFNVDKKISSDLLEHFSIKTDEPFISTVSVFGKNNANIAPIINEKKEYIGYLTSDIVLEELAKFPYFDEHFTWINIQTTTAKFAMSEVAKIIESNNARNFGVLINRQDQNSTSAIIKVRSENIDSLIQTFERFGYEVRTFKKEGDYNDLLNDRYSNLLKYMEF